MTFKFKLAQGANSNTMIFAVVAFIVLAANRSFFAHTLAAYEIDRHNYLALALLPIGLAAATTFLVGILAFGRLTKPVLGLALLVSAAAAYFMDGFGVVINDEMLRNVAQTNVAEAADQLTWRLLAYLLLLWVLPLAVLTQVPVKWRGWRREILARLAVLGGSVLVLVVIGGSFGGFYASFVREHKELRAYANPAYPIYGLAKFLKAASAAATVGAVTVIGADAHRPADDVHRELIILVVGETARADRFSLNGYARETNPVLRREKVVSFTNVTACGTSTAVSVPCMFSSLGRQGFSVHAARRQENVLDVIQRSGAYVHWIDNNSDSKGVAQRVAFQDFRTAASNPRCDDECRDEGMLSGLQQIIDAHPDGDIVIVLHQMGNHGPAYFKRYPPAFEKFRPVCRDKDLSRCSAAEIGNAYDNAILYTDYFLGQVIALLKSNDAKFETAMFYLSDHGESLGENGIYLHGLPFSLAPHQQVAVPAIMWFGANFDEIDISVLRAERDRPLTHDHLFHTLLGFLEIETSAYLPERDILRDAKKPEHR